VFSHKHPGDHESRDDEKDIDADEPSWHREPRVEGNNEEDGDSPESLDV
jgi:hypothetical protein